MGIRKKHAKVLRNTISPNLVKFLLDKGADLNHGGADGWTPLMYAINGKKLENMRLLLDRGADVEKADESGKTFLVFLLLCCQV